MDAKQAMDSRRFCLLMDDMARTWRDKKASDEDKEFRLAALLLFFEEKEADEETAKVQRATPPRRPPAPEPFEPAPGGAEMTPEEEKHFARLADEAAAANVPQETVIGWVIEDVVKPAVVQGRRTIAIPLKCRGRQVSMNHDRWMACLKQHGVYANAVEWSHDPRSWSGPAPVQGQSVPMVLG